MEIEFEPLTGPHVVLEPVTMAHAPQLHAIGQQFDDWVYLPIAGLPSLQEARHWVSRAIALAEAGSQLTYVLVATDTGAVMGSSRFLNIRPEHRVLEIGYSWLGRQYQRSCVNTEAKLLLLQSAFDSMGANRVELKTDNRNARSQRAIERLGAHREGLLRSHMVAQGGYVRDTVMYSIIRSEWPGVRDRLEEMLATRI